MVYNTSMESVRSVHLTPRLGWGGRGFLGCDIKFGICESLPLRKKDRLQREEGIGMGSVLDKLTNDNRQSDKYKESFMSK